MKILLDKNNGSAIIPSMGSLHKIILSGLNRQKIKNFYLLRKFNLPISTVNSVEMGFLFL
jgi:hypothetical protein